MSDAERSAFARSLVDRLFERARAVGSPPESDGDQPTTCRDDSATPAALGDVRTDRFVDDGVGLIYGGSSHGGLPDTADRGSMRYFRLVLGFGEERRLSTLVRWDVGRMAFARWQPAAYTGENGVWVDDARLIDYVLGENQGRSEEIDASAAQRFMAGEAQ